MIGLLDTAVVYTRDAATGAFSTVAQSALACRLAHVNQQPGATGDQRAELAAMRNLLWDPSYVMPELCQVEVNADGVRWQPEKGTFGAFRGPMGTVIYRRCDLRRQGT